MSQGMRAVSKDCKRQENSPLKPPKRSETCFRLLNHNKVSEVKSLSLIQLFAAPWTVDYSPIAPLSMRFSRQGYWSGLTFPTPGDLPNQGLNPGLLYCRQTLYRLSHQGIPKPQYHMILIKICVCLNYQVLW